jgi:carbon monoxide dehydrogenase subunit G
MTMAGHVDVRVPVAAPVEVVWRVANDPERWAAGGHPVHDLRIDGDTATFAVTTPADGAGRSFSYRVERSQDPVRRTVYSRRIGSADFRYSHVWFSYEPCAGGTEMRCVIDFEMTPLATATDEAMAATMQRAIRHNMLGIAELVIQERGE